MIRGKYIHQGEDYSDAISVRMKVFVEEQHVPKDHELDEWDEKAIHAVAYNDNNQPVATGRLVMDDQYNFHIGRVAVLKEYRRQKYGDFIVRLLADQAFQCAAREIEIHAQTEAIPFYETLGFQVVGLPFVEENIEHVSMLLKRGDMKTACGHTVG